MKKLHTLVLLLACTLAVGCSSGGDDPIDDPKPTPTPTPTPTPSDPTDADLANYKCPTYVDNYVSIADWSKRSQWNLANVHDPSVVRLLMDITICIRLMPAMAMPTKVMDTSMLVEAKTS